MSDSDSDWDDHDLNAVIDRLRASPTDSSLSSQATAVESGAVTERVDISDTTSLKSPNSTSPPPPPLSPSPSPSPSPRPQWKRNDRFYMSLVTFRVKDQLFRVPREGFQNGSEYFRKMFTVNEGIAGPRKGDSDTNSIYLEGIEEESFEYFLRLLYPQGPNLYLSRGAETYLSILKLAHMWRFNDIREYCISMLEHASFEVVSRIKIAHDFEIKSWYMPSYVMLAKRLHPINIREAERLGFRFAVKMAQVRERRLTRGPKYVDEDDEILKKDIRELLFVDSGDTPEE